MPIPGITERIICAAVRDTARADDGSFEAILAVNTPIPAGGPGNASGKQIALRDISLERYRQNPVVLWCHDAHSMPIGTTETITRTKDGALRARFRFDDDNPAAKAIRRQWEDGFLRGASIGLISDDDGQLSLGEWSIVPVPADKHAVTLHRAAAAFLEPEKPQKASDTMSQKNAPEQLAGITEQDVKDAIENALRRSRLGVNAAQRYADLLPKEYSPWATGDSELGVLRAAGTAQGIDQAETRNADFLRAELGKIREARKAASEQSKKAATRAVDQSIFNQVLSVDMIHNLSKK